MIGWLTLLLLVLPVPLSRAEREATGPSARTQVFPVGHSPSAMVSDGQNLWVATGLDTVVKLRMSDGVILGSFATGHIPHAVAFDGGNIWVSNAGDGSITELRASDGAFLASVATGYAYANGILYDGESIWVACGGGLTKIRPSDATIIGHYVTGIVVEDVAFDGANVWVTDQSTRTATKVRASDGVILGSYTVAGTAVGITYDGANMWVATSGKTLTKIRASDLTLVGKYKTTAFFPTYVAFDGKNIWTTTNTDVERFRASTGRLLTESLVGTNPQGIYFDGKDVWVSDGAAGTVTKIRP